MSSKIKSMFARHNSQLAHSTIENNEESSAIMQEMTVMPRNFILGPVASSSRENKRMELPEDGTIIIRDDHVKRRQRTSLGAIEDLLQCPVCMERLKSPRMMPCQHTFCEECLEEQLTYASDLDRVIICPLCKLKVVDSVPKNLPTNLYIESLLRVMVNPDEKVDHLEATSPVISFAPLHNQPNSLQGHYQSITPAEPEKIRCSRCETASDRDNRCKHCKQYFCGVCWVAHTEDLKDQLGNIVDQLEATANKFDLRIDEYKAKAAKLNAYIDKDIETRIAELRAEREERIKRANASVRRGEESAAKLKEEIIEAQIEVNSHRNEKFDTLADNKEKVKTFLSLHRKANDLVTAVAQWKPELSDDADGESKEYFDCTKSAENPSFYYRTKKFVPKVIATRGTVQRPSGIALDPWKDRLFVACPGTRHVVVLDRKYKVHRRIHHEDMMSPQGVAFLEDIEELFVTDKWKHCIHVFNRKGEFLRRLCSKGSGEGHLRSPEGIAAHPSLNLLYVADTGNDRVHILQADGTVYGTIGPHTGSATTLMQGGVLVSVLRSHFNQPTDVAVTLSSIVVADSGNHNIKIFNHDGHLMRSIGSPGSIRELLRSPQTVAVDRKGNIIVGDSGNARIQIFSPHGELLRILGTRGNKEGQFEWVSAILVKDDMEMVVADSKNFTVQIF